MLFRISVNETNFTYSSSTNTGPIPDIFDVLGSAHHSGIRDGFVSKVRGGWECWSFEQLTNEGLQMQLPVTLRRTKKNEILQTFTVQPKQPIFNFCASLGIF